MKVVFITPAANIRRTFVYRLGASFYGQTETPVAKAHGVLDI